MMVEKALRFPQTKDELVSFAKVNKDFLLSHLDSFSKKEQERIRKLFMHFCDDRLSEK